MMFWLFSILIIFISFSKLSLPLSPEYCFSFEKAFTATIFSSTSLSAK